MVKKPAQTVTRRAEEGEALIARVHRSNLAPADAGMVEQSIRMYFWVAFALQEAKLRVKRLWDLFFGPSRKRTGAPECAASSPSSEPWNEGAEGGEPEVVAAVASGRAAARCEGGGPEASSGEAEPKPKGGHRHGTGRLSAGAYVGAARTACRPEELAVGERCPVCGHICTATLPATAGEEKYRARARAVLAIGRYSLGLPLYRLQGYQAMLGGPGPDATQWDQIEQVGDCSYVVFEYWETLAAQGALIHQDDTAVRMLSLLDEHLKLRAHAEARG